MKAALTAALLAIGLSASVTPATAQALDWRNYFSEENNGEGNCPGGIGGLKCNGGWCDNISLGCLPGAIGSSDGSYGAFFSEEAPNNQYRCPTGQVATGMKCEGAYCDNVALKCAPTKLTLSDCAWTDYTSEEQPAGLNFGGKVMTGLECRGGYCDEKRARICSASKKKVVIGAPSGEWQLACSGGQNCNSQFTESLNIGRLSEESWSNETQASLSTTVSAGSNYLGVDYSVSVSAGFQATQSAAGRIARSTDKSYSSTCAVDVNLTDYDIFAVWQWVVNTPVDNVPVSIKTCAITCTPDAAPPNYIPGAAPNLTACKRKPGAVNRGTSAGLSAAPNMVGLAPTTTSAAPASAVNGPKIEVASAQYGHNCPLANNGYSQDNTTRHVAAQCNGKTNCDYTIDFYNLGDPSPGCAKDYAVSFNCNLGGNSFGSGYETVQGEAGFGSVVSLNCGPRISILSATYGRNCGAAPNNVSNRMTSACAWGSCDYTVDVAVLGDPAPGCAKDFDVEYKCSNSDAIGRKKINAEANGQSVAMSCN